MSGVAFITGASSGLGAALAPRLAADGYVVALAARRAEKLEAVTARIAAAGGTAVAVPLDVTDRDAVLRAVERVESENGPVDLLVANAGVGDPTPAKRFSGETFDHVFGVNVHGAVYCIEAVLPGMLERRAGHIVGISSIAGFRGLPFYSAYNASKSAMTTMLESLRIELRRKGIYVTAICPGFFASDMTAKSKVPMPFFMSTEKTAAKVHRAIRRRKRIYAFPWPLALAAGLGRRMPAWLYDSVLSAIPIAKKS